MQQYVRRIRFANYASEVKMVLEDAKLNNAFSEGLVYEAIKKFSGKHCRNFQSGHLLAKQIPTEKIPTLDRAILNSVLSCAAQNFDYELACKSFSAIQDPDWFHFCCFLSSLKEANMNRLPPQVVKELDSFWKKVQYFRIENDFKLLTHLWSVLSFSRQKQKELILQVLTQPPSISFNCIMLNFFMKHCASTNNIDLAEKVWSWGKPVIDCSKGTYPFFVLAFQYYRIKTPPIDELKMIWGEVVTAGFDNRAELISSMCYLLSVDRVEQKNFIISILSKVPDFSCHFLGGFLKHCSETKDVAFAKEIWNWGKPILDKEEGTINYFLITFQYLSLFPPSLKPLKDLWNEVKNFHLDNLADAVNAMCHALSFDPEEQRNFILSYLSREPNESFNCDLLGAFLKPCSKQNDLELARQIWFWGREIRRREKGSVSLGVITSQYLSICGGPSGDLILLDEALDEARKCSVFGFIKVKAAFIVALANKGATDRLLEHVQNLTSDHINDENLSPILGAMCRVGLNLEALNLLRRMKQESPKTISGASYSIVINGFSKSGDFKSAFSLIEEGRGHGIEPNVAIWTSILNGCLTHKNLPVALNAFEELRNVNHTPEDLKAAYELLAEIHQSCGVNVTASDIRKDIVIKGSSKVVV